MQKKIALSAIVLTRNSERTLNDTLRSVSFCDEVCVVDDCSTDNTVEIAKQNKANIFFRSLGGDFAAQRNFGLSIAKGDWVLFVDSDEIVSEALKFEIREAIKTIDVNGWYVKRQDVMWGTMLRYGETESVRLLRLAKRGSGEWKRPVHEVWEVPTPVATLRSPLLHTPHPDVAHFLYDIDTYSTINAQHFFATLGKAAGWQIVLYPVAKFFMNYVFRKGFLDGMPGLIYAVMMSFHSFLTRSKLWQLHYKRVS